MVENCMMVAGLDVWWLNWKDLNRIGSAVLDVTERKLLKSLLIRCE
jgi:hypothetical protein